MSKDIMTVKDAAEYLGMSLNTMYKLLKKRKIPGRKIGYQWRISKATLDRFLEGEK